jgi:uncharacterized LabA/DUF88 family protein
MIERSRRVVLLIDYDNLQICASRDTPGRELQLTPVVQLAQRYGTVILARAYAEWNLSTERLAVYKAGIEPAFAPVLRTESDRSGKSLADTVMVAEGMDMLWTLSPDVVVLATSDKDLIPLVRVAKQRGAFVVVLGSDFTAIPLREMADDHFTYRQLITDGTGRFATEAGPARQPAALPEPTRRRSRERNGRDRTPATPAATTPTTPTRPEREAVRPERDVARPEREAAAPTPAGAAEPVAPVTAGSAGDIDSQTGTRRRRRRGSRRRSDRLGQPVEGATNAEAASSTEGLFSEETEFDEGLPIAEAEVGQASSGTVEAPASEPTEVEPPVSEPIVTEAPAAAPRDRRRRTRRPAAEAATEGATEAPAGGEPEAVEAVTEMPVAEPGAVEANGASPGEVPAPPARTPRPRRVASAARGRTRPPR